MRFLRFLLRISLLGALGGLWLLALAAAVLLGVVYAGVGLAESTTGIAAIETIAEAIANRYICCGS